MGRGDQSVFPRRLDTQNVAGADGELTVSISGKMAFIHDGKTPGGIPLVDSLGPGLMRSTKGYTLLNKRPIRILGIGDSIMQDNSSSFASGTGPNGPIPSNWSDSIGLFETSLWRANAVSTQRPPYKFIANMGIGGQTTSQILARFQTDVIAQNPDVCFIIAGTNDLLFGMGPAGIKSLMNNVEQMLMLCIANGIQPILCTPPCKTDTPAEPMEIQPYYYDLAAYYGIPLLDIYRLVTNPADGTYIDTFSADGIHPSPQAIDVIATEFAKALANPEAYIRRPYIATVGLLTPGSNAQMILNANFTQGGGDTPNGWTINTSIGSADTSGAAVAPYTGFKYVYTSTGEGGYALYSTDINTNFQPGDVLDLVASVAITGMTPGTSVGPSFQIAFDGFGGDARPLNSFPYNGEVVVDQECYVPQDCTTMNVQLYIQDADATFTVQGMTLTNRSARQRIWQPGLQ